jgi:hypothetical protein
LLLFESISEMSTPFEQIYENGVWGKSNEIGEKYFSGIGSHDGAIVGSYVSAVRSFLESLADVPDVVDLGCGDFAVGSQIRPYCRKYIAADAVDGLIARNKQKFANEDVEFRVVDITRDELPTADVAFVRQVFQHLSNSDIQKAIPKLSANYRYVVLTEHLPAGQQFTPNLDKTSGADTRMDLGNGGSGVVLTEPPFSLAVKDSAVLCEVSLDAIGMKGVVRTNLYTLR